MLEASIHHESLDSLVGHEDLKTPRNAKPPGGMRATKVRWIALALACLTCLGDYYCVDLPQALQTYLMKELDLEVLNFNVIYSFYSVPNTILPFFGGLIIDYLGIKMAYSLFAIFVVIGQSIATFGIYKLDMTIILVGRIIFAIGGDSIIVAKSAMIAKWFMGKELSFALGAGLCVARLGSSLNSFLSPKLYDFSRHLYVPYLFGIVLSIISCISVFALNYIDRKADQAHQEANAEIKEEDSKASLQDLKNLRLNYYLLVFSSVFLYGGLFGLTNNINDLMVKRFGFTPSTAGNIIPIIYVCPVIITPFFGTFSDKKGKRVLMILIGSIIFSLDHLAIAFLPNTTSHPNYAIAICLFGVGLFYATYAAVFWPCIAIVVGQKLMGIGYGIAFSAENLMLAFLPLALGKIHDQTLDNSLGYFWTEITLAGIVAAAVVLNIWIYIDDMRNGGKLDKPVPPEETEALRSKAVLSLASV